MTLIIRWNQLPWHVNCPWYQSSKVFRVVSEILGGLALTLAGWSYYLDKRSWGRISSRDLKICTGILAGIALLLRNMPLFARDPAYFYTNVIKFGPSFLSETTMGTKTCRKGS